MINLEDVMLKCVAIRALVENEHGCNDRQLFVIMLICVFKFVDSNLPDNYNVLIFFLAVMNFVYISISSTSRV